MKRWNKLIFCTLVQIQDSYQLIQLFLGKPVKNDHGLLIHETLKFAVSQE